MKCLKELILIACLQRGENVKTIVFGAGYMGRVYIYYTKEKPNEQIVAVVDNNPKLYGTNNYGHRISSPSIVTQLDYDQIIIAVDDTLPAGQSAICDITKQLQDMGCPFSKIRLPRYKRQDALKDARIAFVEQLARTVSAENFAVAECGVFRGQFAQYINEAFPKSIFYMFDSFEGFSEADIEKSPESKIFIDGINSCTKETRREWFKQGSELISLLRCHHRENVVIKKGFVPIHSRA